MGLYKNNVAKIRETLRSSTQKPRLYSEFCCSGSPPPSLFRKGHPNKVEWGDVTERAYQTAKAHLSSKPILRLPDPKKTDYLRMYPEDYGIGAVLLQEHKGRLFPVSNASRLSFCTSARKVVPLNRKLTNFDKK